LPYVTKTGLPDLSGSISLAPNKSAFAAGEPVQINVTVTNSGSAPSESTWADLYINPSTPPTGPNMVWNSLCQLKPCFGLAWIVPTLNPGQSVTLSSASGSYAGPYSVWPGWFAKGTSDLYFYVDSYNRGVPTGAVVESNESNNRAELHGLSVTGSNPALNGGALNLDIPPRPDLTAP
jgi:hypothetical protein